MKRFAIGLLSMLAVLALLVPTASFAGPGRPETATVRADVTAPAVPGEFLVKFTAGSKGMTRNNVAAANGGQIKSSIKALDIDVLEFPALKSNATNPKAVEQLINNLKKNPNVEFVEPNYIYSVNYTPNDSNYGSQWAWNVIKAPQAWDVTQGSSSVVVAVVDTGIQRNHPDLDSKIVAGYDYVSNDTAADDGNGHGTHVAGTVAAETNNAQGGAGTCPNCKLMPVRVLDNNGSGTMANVASGITWAADNGAKVINLSLGGGGAATLQTAVDYAWGKGVFLACAAGNSNTSAMSYPGGYTNCFAVASTTSSDARSSFSNYGSWVELAAPGSDIYSTWINSGYNTISGTSMATPHVAGTAGLLASQGLTNAQIRDRLCSTADDISGTGTYWTCGRMNNYAAVSGSVTPPPPPPPPTGTAIQNGGFESGAANWSQSSTGGYQLIDTARPRTGSYGAWMGGYNSGTDNLYQAVTIPANGQLKYYWYLTSSEGTSTAYDKMYVRLYNTSGGLVATLRTWSNRNTRNVWSLDTINLGAYAGQTLRVQFVVTTDSSITSSFYIDDVSLSY